MSISITPSCQESQDENPPMSGNSADLVFQNGKIYTVDESQMWAEAIAIKDGEIIFVGTDTDAEIFIGENTSVEDLGGKMMMPGIHDVHLHPLEAASDNFQFIVNEGVTDPEDYGLDVETAMQENPGTGWLLGWGFDLEVLFEATRSPIEILDEVAPNRPVGIMELTSHSIWANSKALELMGITIDSENPIGGIIMREDDDSPNGIFMDNAGNLLIDLALPVTTQSKENDYWGLVEFALPELAKMVLLQFVMPEHIGKEIITKLGKK